MSKICPNCGQELKDDQLFCTNCGEKFEEKQMFKEMSSCPISSLAKGVDRIHNFQTIVGAIGKAPAVDDGTLNKCAAHGNRRGKTASHNGYLVPEPRRTLLPHRRQPRRPSSSRWSGSTRRSVRSTCPR